MLIGFDFISFEEKLECGDYDKKDVKTLLKYAYYLENKNASLKNESNSSEEKCYWVSYQLSFNNVISYTDLVLKIHPFKYISNLNNKSSAKAQYTLLNYKEISKADYDLYNNGLDL